jgi:hypothetical protein
MKHGIVGFDQLEPIRMVSRSAFSNGRGPIPCFLTPQAFQLLLPVGQANRPNDAKRQMLARIFSPPLGIMFDGPFTNVGSPFDFEKMKSLVHIRLN